MPEVYIYGAGNLGREIADCIRVLNEKLEDKIIIKAFIVDSEFYDTLIPKVDNIEIVNASTFSKEIWQTISIIIGIGDSIARSKIINKIRNYGASLFNNIIHPTAFIANDVIIGEGSYIGPNTTISIACKIGSNVVINQNCSIGHDCDIEDNVVICPGVIISGRCKIGKQTYVGSGAVILPTLLINEGCIIGANVTVSKSIKSNIKLLNVSRNIELPII